MRRAARSKVTRTCYASHCNHLINRSAVFCNDCTRELRFHTRESLREANIKNDPLSMQNAIINARKELEENRGQDANT